MLAYRDLTTSVTFAFRLAVLAPRSARPLLTSAGRPAIAYSRVRTSGTPSAVPSSSNVPASHLGSELALIAQSCRAFSSLPLARQIVPPGLFSGRRRPHCLRQRLTPVSCGFHAASRDDILRGGFFACAS